MKERKVDMGFTEILTVVFIALKLIGVIGWSWWLVLLPEIIAVVFYIAVFLFVVLFSAKQEADIRKTIRKMNRGNRPYAK